MPFTISHAAAVLPFRRTRLPLAALMIGSMSPDFAYFAPLGSLRDPHSVAGLFWFCVPVGLAVWLLFVRFVERPSIALLPGPWRQRVSPTEATFSPVMLLLAALAVLSGAITHLLWDSLTHSETATGYAIEPLHTVVLEIRGRSLTIFRVLQYVSSIGGLLVLAIWAWRIRARPVVVATDPGAPVSHRVRVAALLLMIIATVGTALAYLVAHSHLAFGKRMSFMLVGGMIGGFLSWFVVAVLVDQLCLGKTSAPQDQPQR